MLLAHLPAGYLLATRGRTRRFFAACLAGSIAPDLDMIWFYLVDRGARHHHTYWSHTPWCWALVVGLVALGATLAKRPDLARVAGAFGLGILLHLVLDTFVGDIRWLAPVDDRFVSLFSVPAIPGRHWVLNFILHWSFLAELALMAAATWSFARRRTILGA